MKEFAFNETPSSKTLVINWNSGQDYNLNGFTFEWSLLKILDKVKIPRRIGYFINHLKVKLHTFIDASKIQITTEPETKVSLLPRKSNVEMK